jgi:hypothetical protein
MLQRLRPGVTNGLGTHIRRPQGLVPNVVIVGAGPHGLTMAVRLLANYPSLVGQVVVVDSGGWLEAWDRKFTGQGIDLLRSRDTHHPGPYPRALIDWARRQGRSGELVGALGRPTTELFHDYGHALVEHYHLNDVLLRGGVTALHDHLHDDRVSVTYKDGGGHERILTPHTVIVATNPAIPNRSWLTGINMSSRCADGVVPVEDLRVQDRIADLTSRRASKRHVLIVGTGQSGAWLAARAADAGFTVTMSTHTDVRVSDFDFDPRWTQTGAQREFRQLPVPTRVNALAMARVGGSITPDLAERIVRHAERHRLSVLRRTKLENISWCDRANAVLVSLCGEYPVKPHGSREHEMHVDEIWVATGSSLDITQDPMFASFGFGSTAAVHSGLPLLDEALAVRSRHHAKKRYAAVHLMGGYAGLSVGPSARNLIGGQAQARLIERGLAQRLRAPRVAPLAAG